MVSLARCSGMVWGVFGAVPGGALGAVAFDVWRFDAAVVLAEEGRFAAPG